MRTAMTMMAMTLTLAINLAVCAVRATADELKPANVLNVKGDGPDGKGNTDDDTWGFWFEIAHNKQYGRLSLATLNLTPEQRKDGIRDPKAKRGAGKVRGPVASLLPNPDDSEGWIFGRDWDGRFEGVWADKKSDSVLAHPYVEKTHHGAVAITYRIPKTGAYKISGKLTDVQINSMAPHDGISFRVEQVAAQTKLLDKGGPIGDNKGPESMTFEIPSTSFNQGDQVRLVIHPNSWWGQDLTRIDSFKIEPVEAK